jgi:hypothetical protein
MATSQCLCGEVAFEVDPPLQLVHDCHCTRCQKSHGTASVTMAAVPRSAMRWLRGEEKIARYATGADAERAFCRRCGSGMPNGGDFRGLTFVPIGALEGDFEAVSDGHIFVASKAPWHDMDDGLPAFDAFPPGVDAPVLDDLSRGARTPGRVGGSCLCGEVSFELEGKPTLMRRCHCLRCRRARSHSHAANALYPREALHWTGGRDRAALYKLPEAERFSQAFCGTCGGKAPWLVEARDAWVVPLGALDDDPGGKPSEHIFVDSKAPWFQITDDMPQYREYPE